MSVDDETFAFTIGGIAAAAAAIGILYYMFGEGSGFDLPRGRYPIILLIAIVVGPPLIGGAVAFFAAAYGIGHPIYYLMQRKANAADAVRSAAETETKKQREADAERAREKRKAEAERAREKREAEQAAAREKAKREEAEELEKVRGAVANGDVVTFENALRQHPPEFVSMLLAPDPASGTTVGHTAARDGHVAMLESIARNGLFELYRDRGGQTMLDIGPAERRNDLELAYCRGHAKHVVEARQLDFDDEQINLLARFFVERAKLRHHDTKALYILDGTRSQIAEFFSDAAAEAEQRGEYERARSNAIGWARIVPDAIDPLIRMASANLHLKNYAAVIADANAALKLDLQRAEPFRLRGLALAAQGRAAEALLDFERSLGCDADQPDLQPHLDAARAQRERDDVEYLKTMRVAVARGDVVAFNHCAFREGAFREKVMEPDAETGTSAAHQAALGGHMDMIELLGANTYVRFHRDRDGKTLLDMGATPEQVEALETAYARGFGRAMTTYWKLTEMTGENAEVFAKFWESRLKLRHNEKEPIFKISGNTRDASDYFCDMVNGCMSRKEYDKALTFAKAAVDFEPKSAHPLVIRSWAYLNTQQLDAAIADADAALAINPSSYWAYRFRGGARAGLGRKADAVADYAKSLELNPDQADLQERLNELIMS